MKNITQALEWRYATKHYDTSKKISEEDLQTLKESIRLSPSSYGLQPFKVIEVKDLEIRSKLRAASWDQPQLTDASSVFVFTVPLDITEEMINEYMELTAKTRDVSVESLTGFSTMIKGAVNSQTPEQKSIWATKQAYIALGFLLETAAILEIDGTPMEGFDSEHYDAILGLTEKGLKSVVVCTLGYRSDDDSYSKLAKVRKSSDDMFMLV